MIRDEIRAFKNPSFADSMNDFVVVGKFFDDAVSFAFFEF